MTIGRIMANARECVQVENDEVSRLFQGLLRMNANDCEWWRMGVLAEGVGFEPTRERNPLPVFKTGALNHSATLPEQRSLSNPTDCVKGLR
jgi:hypothetical protein